MTMDNEGLVSVQRLSRDLARAPMGREEARFLVDAYYMMQEDRKRAHNQFRSLTEGGEPNSVIAWLALQSQTLEKQIQRALDAYSNADALGRWAREIVGIGPVIAAGLLCHVDVERSPVVGHVWRFAGLDPTLEWKKGEKRPFNAALKTLCWKIGESFVKTMNHPEQTYGEVYKARRELEQRYNDEGKHAQAAAKMLAAVPKHAQAETYRQGKLPDGHLHARAKRYAVKLFLAHYHEKGRQLLGLPVPLPYAIAHLGHAHKIEPKP